MASNSLGNAYIKIRGDIGDLKSDLDKALATIKNLETKVDASNKKMASSFGSINDAIKGVKTSLVGIVGAIATWSVTKNIVDAGVAAEKMGKGLEAALGSVKAATEAQKFLRTESERLGLVFQDQVKSYTSLSAAARGTAMEGDNTRKIFTAVATASTALGLSADEASGSLNAIQQMMSKGKVQAEELRGQLGERLPGAFKMAAEAMGVTEQELGKMLEQGKVLADDLLPRLADILINRYGDAATSSALMVQASINKMVTAFNDLKVEMYKSFSPELNNVIKTITETMKNMQEELSKPEAKIAVHALAMSFSELVKQLGTDIPGKITSIANALKAIVDIYNKLPADVVGAAGAGLIGAMLFGKGAGLIVAGLTYTSSKIDEFKKLHPEIFGGEVTVIRMKIPTEISGEASSLMNDIKTKTETIKSDISSIAPVAASTTKSASNAVYSLKQALETLDAKMADMQNDNYSKELANINKEYNQQAKAVGTNAEGLQKLNAWRDMAISKLEKQTEYEKTMATTYSEISMELAKLTINANEYAKLELDKWFYEESNAAGADTEQLKKLYEIKKKILDANQAYAEAPLSEDPWIKHLKKKQELSDDTDKDIAEATKKSQEDAAKDLNKIWDKAWKNIESSFADSIYDMMENGIDSFDDFFDSILKMFEKLLAEMVAAWLVSGLKTLLTGGEGAFSLSSLFGMGSAGVSATDVAKGALSLSSVYDSLASGLDSLVSGLTYVTDALGLTTAAATTAAESAAAAAAVQATSTAAAAATMEGIAEAATTAAASVADLGAASATSAASFEALESSLAATTTSATTTAGAEMGAMSTLGAAAAVAGVTYFIGSGAFESVVRGLFGYGSGDERGLTDEEMIALLRANEAGTVTLSEEDKDWYMQVALGLDHVIEELHTKSYWNEGGEHTYLDFDLGEWYAANEKLLDMTMAEYDNLMAQQAELFDVQTKNWQKSYYDSKEAERGGQGWTDKTGYIGDTMGQAYVDVAIRIADDATLPLEQKMYQLGFVVNDSGGWQSDATMAMLAEFSDQGVPWSEIQQVLTDIGAMGANEEVIKNIYAVYHGVSYWPTWESVEAALTAVGYDSEVIKAIKTEFSGDMTYDELSKLIYDAYTSPDMLAEVMVMIDPSDEWKDLVIPVDAPDSIPVSWDGQPTGMATGGPVSAGTPYIIGEVGPELFVPQESGHILSNSNMKKLMGMGVQGFAEGTTDPLPGTAEWYEMYPPSEYDVSGSSDISPSSSYETLAEWQADYNKQLEEYLGLTTDLGDALTDITDYYTEQIQIATELGATEEQLNQLLIDQNLAKEKAMADWYASETDYYNQMMGLNTELGDTLDDIASHYDDAIASAEAAGLSEEELAKIREAEATVAAQAMADWYASETDYYNQMMGLNTELGTTLDDIASHYDEAIASAEAAGATEEELAQIRATEATVAAQAMADWYASETDYYNQMMGLNSSLGDTLDSISQHYDDAIASAEAAGATEEELAKIRETEATVTQKAIEDAAKAYEDYYSEMMGMNTSLGDQIAEVNKYYEEQIANANAADPTGAAASQLETDQAEIIQQLINEWASSYSEYVDDMLGNTSQLADDLAAVNEYYAEQLATAVEIGMTTDEINQMLAEQAAIQQQILDEYVSEYNEWLLDTLGIQNDLADSLNSISDYYEQMVVDLEMIGVSSEDINALLAQEEAVLQVIAYQTLVDMAQTIAEINGYATELSSEMAAIARAYGEMLKNAYTLVSMDLARPVTLAIIAMSAGISMLNVIGQSRADAEAQAIADISSASSDRYDAESQAIEDLKGEIKDLQSIIDSISDTMMDLEYSKYNLALPSQTMESAQSDYATLLAAAQTGDPEAIQAYEDFINTYLQSAQDQYKSSAEYQDIYNQVMADLSGVQANAQEQLTLDQQLLTEMEEELASIQGSSGNTAESTAAIAEAQETVFSNIAAVLLSAASVMETFVVNYNTVMPILTTAVGTIATALTSMAENLLEISEWFINGMQNGFTADGFIKDRLLNIYTKVNDLVDNLNEIGKNIEHIGNIIYAIGFYMPGILSDVSDRLMEIGTEIVGIGDTMANLAPSLRGMFADIKVIVDYLKTLTPATDTEYLSQTALNTSAMSYSLYALDKFLAVPGYADGGISTGPTSGYPVTLHGTEAIVPLGDGSSIPVTLSGTTSGGQSDPEIKALLQELVSVSREKQNVTFTLDDGTSFRGYIRREADAARVEANSRPGMENRRIYN